MEVVENKIDELNSELVVKINKEDYYPSYEKQLKDYRKKVNLPGFRNGKVPLKVIENRYGKALLAEELNQLLSQQLNEHIEQNDLRVLGQPLPKKDGEKGDWEQPGDFEFSYEVGLAPDFELKFSEKDKFKFYKVKIDDKLIDKQLEDLRRRYGKMSQVEEANEKDLVLGVFQELDKSGEVKEDGIIHESSIGIEFTEDKKVKKQLIGLKVGESIEVDPFKVSKGEADTAAMLGIKKEELPGISKKFRFTAKEIKRIDLAEVDQEFFDKIYGEGNVTSEDELREKISEDLARMFERDSDKVFFNQVIEVLMEKHPLNLPDEFLKRWITETGGEDITREKVEEEYEQYAKGLRWQLLQGRLIETHNLGANEEELTGFTMQLMANNYAQYGVPAPAEDELRKSAIEMLTKNRDEARKIQDMLYENKLQQFFKSYVKLSEKEVSYDDFVKIANKEKK